MSFVDFCENFQELELCHLSADVMNEISEMTGLEVTKLPKHQWEEQAHHGEWSTEKGTAGGSRQYPDSYAQNPQFEANFIVTEDSVGQDGKCTVIVAVLQKHRREMLTIGEGSLSIGFSVYEVNACLNVYLIVIEFQDCKQNIESNFELYQYSSEQKDGTKEHLQPNL
ncbi:calpain large subunit, domain III [Ancylostoma caninum]|uniref:Calpain large subunit, domain III n=1 Tax=Ancylostoma caninum TaxID=29170 RepID=A0A368H1C0_ANCCA|nr:calpain large subunit, domain III [Ancylostoma caninum]